jgi:hypothetical protein
MVGSRVEVNESGYALAYYIMATITGVKSFKARAPLAK